METGYLIVLVIVVLVCPVSMWLMMRGHGRKRMNGSELRNGGRQRQLDRPENESSARS